MPDNDLVLEFGDRVGGPGNRASFPAVRRFFGDSIKGTADFSYISVGVGVAVGLVVGMIPLPIPGVGRVTLGLAGVLLVALVLGTFRRTSGIVWTLPRRPTSCCATSGSRCFSPRSGCRPVPGSP